ncbi:MAG: phosphotriesterase family protein [Nocardioides sp.]|uniref:phosphotriesterase family protein n=1 Tax=Nocardioides sp. TaxID=35761 RepID=UPI003D6BE84F
MIPTLTGSVSPNELGRVLMHEHVFVLNAELMVNYPEMFPQDEMVRRAVAVLGEVGKTGIDTFVDLSVMGTGRNVPVLRRIAEQVDLNILVATGWYTYHEAPVFAQLNGPGRLFDGPDPLAEMFVRDIRDGIGGTGVRAAVLKCSADKYGMTDGVMNIMQAVADAHLETGAPIFTHSDPGNETGPAQLDYLESRGIDLSGVVVGHCGDTDEIDRLRRMADRGAVLGMDRFGLESRLPYEARVRTVVDMCRLGYADRMVIATDSSVFSMNFPDEHRREHLPLWDARAVMPRVVTDLRASGVGDDDIDQMMQRNPARILHGSCR